ncbi:MAG: hypothetical protein ACOX87_00960 [Chloroflexota bacterium]|jgi:hypothetical protein
MRIESEEGKTLTIKINLEGPAEVLSWVQGKTPDKMAGKLAGLIPGDFKKHVKAASREQLLAMRSLIDIALARIDADEQPQRRATKVEID